MIKYVINPFSKEAAGILKTSPPIDRLPESVINLARKKIYGGGRDVIESYDITDDILSFYLLFQSAASKHGSAEIRTVKEITKKILTERMWFLLNASYSSKNPYGYDESFVSRLLSEIFKVAPLENLGFAGSIAPEELRLVSSSDAKEDAVRYAVDWRELLPVLKSRKMSLTELYLVRGYALLSLANLVNFCGETVAALVDEYVEAVGKKIPKNSLFEELGALLSKPSRAVASARAAYAGTGRTSQGLKFNFFPPCIASTLEGVSSGSRNYAITVLLTSFLSYARLSPVGSSKDAKISDYTGDISVVKDEVLPLIYQAAEKCRPPLFADQPLEKLNVIYHLGLGLREDFGIEDAGKSNWYFPPNCDKIRRESPAICTPDEDCKKIKNPLNYYANKLLKKKKVTKTS